MFLFLSVSGHPSALLEPMELIFGAGSYKSFKSHPQHFYLAYKEPELSFSLNHSESSLPMTSPFSSAQTAEERKG
jgi:hypothetical protein